MGTQHRQQKVRDGMPEKVGRNVADPQTPRRIEGLRKPPPSNGGQQARPVALAPFPVRVGHFARAQIGEVIQRGDPPGMRVWLQRIQAEGAGKGQVSLGHVSRLEKRAAEQEVAS